MHHFLIAPSRLFRVSKSVGSLMETYLEPAYQRSCCLLMRDEQRGCEMLRVENRVEKAGSLAAATPRTQPQYL